MKKFLQFAFMFILFSVIQACGIDDKSSFESTEKCIYYSPDGTQCERYAEHGRLYCWKHNLGT